jgi:macrolide-specific efflux system membrane fusion protein
MTDVAAVRSSWKSSRVLAALGVVVAIAAVWLLGSHLLAGRGTDTHVYATLQKQDIEDLVTATGSLQPRDYVDVGAQVSGQLRRIHVEVGTEVKEGDLLAEIDAEQSNARVDASKAQLRSQEAQLAQQNVNLAKAERDLQRQKNLMAEDATTAEQVQNAESTLDATRAQIHALQAQMQQLQASMRVDQANLKYTKIFAPMDGTVVSISARQGQTLNTNQQAPTILRIADLSTMTVQTQVSEADVGKLRTGMAAYFTTLGGGGRRFYGKLSKVEPTPTVTNNVVLYNALFDVPNTNDALLPQMTAQVFFVVAEARDALAAPMSALTMQRAAPAAGQGANQGTNGADRLRKGTTRATRGPRTATVRLASPDGGIVTREVQVGVSNRVHAEILGGLSEGDRVVAGEKVDDKAPTAQGQQNRNAAGAFGPPGGFPGRP